MKTSKLQQGFSLLGLLVFIVIIGIVGLIALPTCHSYAPRARVTEGLALASFAKVAVAENAANGAPFSAGWIAPNATIYVSTKSAPTAADRRTNVYSGIAINPTNGIITVTYSNKIATDADYVPFWQPALDRVISLFKADGIPITDEGTSTLVLLPITEDKGLPVLGQPIKGAVNWQCHSATAPTSNVLTTILGTMNPKYVPINCRR